MDGTRFNMLAKRWATPSSRRRLHGGVIGATLVSVGVRFGVSRLGDVDWIDAGARRQVWTPIADAADAECAAAPDPEYETQCQYTECGTGGKCVVSTSGAWRCAGKLPTLECPSREECADDSDCQPDRVCARLGGRCNSRPVDRKCLRRYGAPLPTPGTPLPTAIQDELWARREAADAVCAAIPAQD
jgi:hypothetical protein